MDLISDLGELAFGTRLKRLLRRLDGDLSRSYKDLGIDFEARWFPVLYLLAREPDMTITGIAKVLQLTHPAVNKFSTEMGKKGLIKSASDGADSRKRRLRLSRKGEEMAVQLTPVWEDIRQVMGTLLQATGVDFMGALATLEQELDRQDIYARLRDRMKPRLLARIEVVDFKAEYKKHFKSLNMEWLKKNFTVEGGDRAMLSDPEGTIIQPGGAVLFAMLDGKVVGTCALVRHEGGLLELAKMAVTESARKRMAGTKLTLAAVDRAKALGADVLYLETNARSIPAIRLYESVGFRRIEKSPIRQRYKRSRIMMKLKLATSC